MSEDSPESIFKTLADRIKLLEFNQSLVSNFLKELSQNYVGQMGDIQETLGNRPPLTHAGKVKQEHIAIMKVVQQTAELSEQVLLPHLLQLQHKFRTRHFDDHIERVSATTVENALHSFQDEIHEALVRTGTVNLLMNRTRAHARYHPSSHHQYSGNDDLFSRRLPALCGEPHTASTADSKGQGASEEKEES